MCSYESYGNQKCFLPGTLERSELGGEITTEVQRWLKGRTSAPTLLGNVGNVVRVRWFEGLVL